MKVIKSLIYILLVAALGGAGYFGWNFYMRAKAPILDAIYILPKDAAVIIGLNDYQKFNEGLSQGNIIWQDFKETYGLGEAKSEFDSLLNSLSKNAEIKKHLDNPHSKFYISAHFSGHNRFETILSLSLSEIPKKKQLENYLEKNYQMTKQEFNDNSIYEIKSKNSKNTYYLTMLGGVISLTTYAPLAEKLIISASLANPDNQALKNRMLKLSGKDIAANIYINYRYFYRLISKYALSEYSNEISSLGQLSQSAALDVQIQNDRISLSGYTLQTDSFASFLGTYQNHKPVDIKVSNILPASTFFMMHQGAEDLSLLLKNRKEGKFSERDEELLVRLKAKYLVNMGDYFYPWIKSELTIAYCNSKSTDNNQGAFTVIECTDAKEAKQSLNKLSNTIIEINELDKDTNDINYRAYEIHHIPLNNLLPALFGKAFSLIEGSYYTVIDNYIVFGNSQEALHYFIDSYLIERTLSNNEIYKNTLADLSNETNILVYANLNKIKPQLLKYLSKEGIDLIEQSGLKFNNFSTMALEYIANDEGIYTTFVLQHGEQEFVDEPISWKTALDNPVARGPFWIKNHNTKNKEVLVFDKTKLMYRIDQNGSIAWAIPLLEYPISEVFMVDYYKNGKYQYLFNSKNYIHLYDLNGNKVENYPIKLPMESTAPMTLVDYDKNKNYRILIPLADGRVYNYRVEGIETPGWKYPNMKNAIHQAVQSFRLGTKDFLVVSDTSGNVIYTNRRGEPRMDAQLAFTNNTNTIFYKNNDVQPAQIITTDLLGRVVSLDAAGKVEKLSLHDFSDRHSFLYFDFNQDKREDYIFLDNNSLYIFNHRNKLILQKDFETTISPKMIGVSMTTADSIRLVLHDMDNQNLILITKSGRVIIGNQYKNNSNFMLDEATKTNILRLTTTYGRIISSFLIK